MSWVSGNDSSRSVSQKLVHLSLELRNLDLALKAGAAPDPMLLQEFRQALDNVRLTAWTVSELQNAAAAQKDTEKLLSFISAERIRRSTQMLRDLWADIDQRRITWQSSGIQKLSDSVNSLQILLRDLLTGKHEPERRA